MASKEGVEGGEVTSFLVVHVLHQGAQVGVSLHYGGSLRGIDKSSSKFAGLVNTELGVRMLT